MPKILQLLVIDDNEDDRLLYRRSLSKAAGTTYEITEADNGEVGLECLQRREPDCILLDYSLPGRDGIEVLKCIRAKNPFVPVVILTGQGNEAIAVTAMKEGAQDYIAKSTVTSETLEHVVRVAIAHADMQQRINEQHSALEIFTHALAHDLKEPTHTIVSFTELLMQQETFSARGNKYVGHLHRAGLRMQRLIQAVFGYSELSIAKLKSTEPCDVAAILHEVEENLAQWISDDSPFITADALPKIDAYPVELQQLLQNLVSNAIHYGGKKVAIHIGVEEKTDHWQFFVRDNGPGIEKEHLETIFDPFKRMSNQPDKRGLGMGLAISRKIVQLHGGKIWCESTVGVGTTFFFTLAKQTPARRDAQSPQLAIISDIAAATHIAGQARVLLVDDSEADLLLNQILLIEQARLQCEVLVATGGEQALHMLQQSIKENNPIDLILLDINMPVMSGFQLMAQLQMHDLMKYTMVVMCSTSSYDIDRQMAFSVGASGYLTKPPQFAQLKSILEQSEHLRLREEAGSYTLLRAA